MIEKSIVFILGAGASAQGGCPVMNNFFECAECLRLHDLLGSVTPDYENIRVVREQLNRSRLKSGLDIGNLEKLFNALEMAEFLDVQSVVPKGLTIDEAKASLVRLISAVLERTQMFSYSELGDSAFSPSHRRSGGRNVGPAGYDDLARFMNLTRSGMPKYRHSCITFNYDTGLEWALRLRGIEFDYCLEGHPANDRVAVFKLHGSTNWLCGPSGRILFEPLDEVPELQQRPAVWPLSIERGDRKFFKTDQRRKVFAEQQGIADLPFIIPPSESKQNSRGTLRSVWHGALAALSAADYVVIVGYSIPDTDEFFRQFFALAGLGEKLRNRVFVFDTAGGDELKKKYADLLGHEAVHSLEHFQRDFCQGIDHLARRWESQFGLL